MNNRSKADMITVTDMRPPSALALMPAKPPQSNQMTRNLLRFAETRFCLILVLLSLSGMHMFAQGPGGRGGPPLTAKQAAPVDLTGYWVAVVVEDWKYRMLPANKGDYSGLPLNAAARKIADTWDPTKDTPPAADCRNYGAANLMRQPGRLHITWQDDQTLKLESDAGTQTRLLSFAPSQNQGGTWQGVSLAAWDTAPGGRGPAPTGSLKIVTTRLRSGFLRSNGVPYSANTTLTEYFDRVEFPDGNLYLVVSSTVEDPANLTVPYLTSVHFKKQADAAGWSPTTCR
jgi:hypothetical protein